MCAEQTFSRDINSILKFYLRASYSSSARLGLASAFIKFSYAILKVSTSQGHCHRTITRTLQQHSSFLTCSTEAHVPSTFSFPVAHLIHFLPLFLGSSQNQTKPTEPFILFPVAVVFCSFLIVLRTIRLSKDVARNSYFYKFKFYVGCMNTCSATYIKHHI